MDDSQLFEIAARQHGVFSRAQAREVGFRADTLRRRVENGRLEHLARNIFRVSGSPMTEHAQLIAVVLSGGTEAIASGTSALALQQIRDFDLMPAVAVLSRRLPRGALAGVRESFRILPTHRTVIDGIPCATVARALIDAARGQPRWTVERAIDSALAARPGLYDELLVVHGDLATSGRSGIVHIRDVLAERNDAYRAPTTWLEARFLDLMREHNIPEPERQVEIFGRAGRIGTVDFAWQSSRLVVETDGRTFHDSLTDRRNDEWRDRQLERERYTVLRFNRNDILHRPTSVVRLVRNALRAAA